MTARGKIFVMSEIGTVDLRVVLIGATALVLRSFADTAPYLPGTGELI
jgi:hypothetical protein